jgi:hypothetical protein
MSENVANFANFVRETKQLCEQHSYALEHYESCSQDLLHQIELGSSSERGKAATRLAKVRKLRRVSKDTIDNFAPLLSLIETAEGKYFMRRLNEVLGEMRKVERSHSNRIYIPKAISEIEIANKHISKT